MVKYRPLKIEDLPYRYKWLNDPEVRKHLGTVVRDGTDMGFHQKWFEGYLKDEARKIFLILDGDKAIGQVGLLDINLADKNACLYVLIGEKEYWGKGIGTEAVEYICEYGFKELGLHKVWLDVHAENTRAVKCYKKYGFKQEGLFRENVWYDGKYQDEIRMAIFKKGK